MNTYDDDDIEFDFFAEPEPVDESEPQRLAFADLRLRNRRSTTAIRRDSGAILPDSGRNFAQRAPARGQARIQASTQSNWQHLRV